MTTMTFQSHVNTGIPGFSSSSTAQSRVAGAEAPSSIVRAVALDRGNLLRTRNGRGGTDPCGQWRPMGYRGEQSRGPRAAAG